MSDNYIDLQEEAEEEAEALAMERHDEEHWGDPTQWYQDCEICAERLAQRELDQEVSRKIEKKITLQKSMENSLMKVCVVKIAKDFRLIPSRISRWLAIAITQRDQPEVFISSKIPASQTLLTKESNTSSQRALSTFSRRATWVTPILRVSAKSSTRILFSLLPREIKKVEGCYEL